MIKFNRTKTASRQRGQGMSEYIIIVALIAVGAIGVFAAFGGTIRSQVAGMSHELAGTDSSADITKAGTQATNATTSANAVKGMDSYNAQNKAK